MSKWDHSFQLSRLLGPNKQCPGLHCAWGVFVTHICFLLHSEGISFYYLFVFHSLCNMSVVFRCFQNNWKTWVWPRNLSWWHVFRRFSAPCGPPMETRSARSMQALVRWMARLRYMSACKIHKQYSTKGSREQKNWCFCAIFPLKVYDCLNGLNLLFFSAFLWLFLFLCGKFTVANCVNLSCDAVFILNLLCFVLNLLC